MLITHKKIVVLFLILPSCWINSPIQKKNKVLYKLIAISPIFLSPQQNGKYSSFLPIICSISLQAFREVEALFLQWSFEFIVCDTIQLKGFDSKTRSVSAVFCLNIKLVPDKPYFGTETGYLVRIKPIHFFLVVKNGKSSSWLIIHVQPVCGRSWVQFSLGTQSISILSCVRLTVFQNTNKQNSYYISLFK